jgi:hypothetical protein
MAKIILSYRRSDSDAIAGRIRDKLVSHYGDDSVFMDIDSIPFGLDFREHVKNALLENDILIAVIGPKWMGPDVNNRSRINEETDPVRIEVETALKRNIPVVPVLVGGASMPLPAELPDGLKDLPFRNAAQIDAGRDFHQHMERLIRSMDRILELKSGRNPDFSSLNRKDHTSIAGRGNVENILPITNPITPTPHRVAGGVLNSLLMKYGLRFSDDQMESEFMAEYRERFFSLGQSAVGLALVGWLALGSIALTASEGKDTASVRFFYVAAPILLIVFFMGFSKAAKQLWQPYYAVTTLVFLAMAYMSVRVLQGASWFRPEYGTMAFMVGIMFLAMGPVVVVYAVILQATIAGVALYYILHDLHMVESPKSYEIFSSIFLGIALLAGCHITVTRETALRRAFAAGRVLSRSKHH